MLVWNATVSDNLSQSYLHKSSSEGGEVPRIADLKKVTKYKNIVEQTYILLPFACGTRRPWFHEKGGSKLGFYFMWEKIVEHSEPEHFVEQLFPRKYIFRFFRVDHAVFFK